MLKATKDATDRAVVLDFGGEDSLVDLGSFADVIHNHDESLSLAWQLGWETESTQSIRTINTPELVSMFRGKAFEISAEVVANEGNIITRQLAYEFAGRTFALALRTEDKRAYDLTASGLPDFRFNRTVGRPWQLPPPVKSYAFPDQARTYYQNASFLSDLELAYEEQINAIYYLGPLREYPKRDYYWSRSRPGDVGPSGRKTIEAILAATEAGETRNLGFKKRYLPFQGVIAHWLREIGLIHDFRMAEIAKGSNRWIAKVVSNKGAPEVALTDVGFGVSQVLPVITLLYYVEPGSTVILEQPEIHLHPLAQAGLADLIVNVATHRNVQVILESHSEHLLLRLQRRIAEGLISQSDVSLYFCDAEKGTSRLSELELDLLGRITNWPPKFMGDAFEETFRAEEARLKRSGAA